MGNQNILVITSNEESRVLKGICSELRIKILQCLRDESLIVNDLARLLDLPQSTVAINVQIWKRRD
jgi:predicted transcriptional regulator